LLLSAASHHVSKLADKAERVFYSAVYTSGCTYTGMHLLGEGSEREREFYVTPLTVAKIIQHQWQMNERVRSIGALILAGEN
jgi:hypothetical protein